MTQPASRTTFAGVDGWTDAGVPAWYDRDRSDDPVSFAEVIRQLPQAIETEVAYRNRYSGDWVPTDRFNALVEPVRLFEQATGEPDEDPLFHVPTDSYSIINPVDVYGPLEDVLRTEKLDGMPLGEVVFGEIRQYRGGGVRWTGHRRGSDGRVRRAGQHPRLPLSWLLIRGLPA